MSQSPVEILTKEFAARQRRNKHYSLRSFARDLDIHPGTLSGVIAGNRCLPRTAVAKVAKALSLSPVATRKLAGQSNLPNEASQTERQKLEDNERYFEIISEWEHFAVLSLMDTNDFQTDTEWISQRLAIGPIRTQVIIQRLLDAGFIAINAKTGKWTKAFPRFSTTDGVRSQALRKAHLDELDIAKEKLLTTDLELRDYSSMTMACHPKNLPALRELIRRFRKEAEFLAEEDSPSEVYQLCVQLFPLTEIENRSSKGTKK